MEREVPGRMALSLPDRPQADRLEPVESAFSHRAMDSFLFLAGLLKSAGLFKGKS